MRTNTNPSPPSRSATAAPPGAPTHTHRCRRLLSAAARGWRKVWLPVLLLGAGSLVAHAQQDPAVVHHWKVPTLWNPAAAGTSPLLTVSGLIQTHAAGFEGAGSTMWAGTHLGLPWGTALHGLGASFLNDEIGLFAHKRFALQYAYHRSWAGGRISAGIQADMLQETFDGTKADPGTSGDPALPASRTSGSSFDLSLGLRYERRALTLDASLQHATAPTIGLDDVHQLEVKRMLNFAAQYNIRALSPLFTIVPCAMVRTDLRDHRIDLGLRAHYTYESRRFYAGINYAPARSVALMAGGTLRGVDLSYSYEANTSGLGLGAGQHEVSLTYTTDLNLRPRSRNLHKSVRWL